MRSNTLTRVSNNPGAVQDRLAWDAACSRSSARTGGRSCRLCSLNGRLDVTTGILKKREEGRETCSQEQQ